MSRADTTENNKTDEVLDAAHDGPLARWKKRKQAVLEEQRALQQKAHEKEHAAPPLTDEDMPPVETLTFDSDFSGFLSPNVSDRLRQLALRKLFHCEEFNVCDGLDDYDGDYTTFAKLGNIVTADMKHQIEMEAQRQKEELVETGSTGQVGDAELPEVTGEPAQVADESAVADVDSDPPDAESQITTQVEMQEDEQLTQSVNMASQDNEMT